MIKYIVGRNHILGSDYFSEPKGMYYPFKLNKNQYEKYGTVWSKDKTDSYVFEFKYDAENYIKAFKGGALIFSDSIDHFFIEEVDNNFLDQLTVKDIIS